MIGLSTLAILIAAATVQAPSPAPTETPSAAGAPAPPAVTESPAPVAAPPAPAATSSASLAPSSPPTASPYAYRFVPKQPVHPIPGAPQIFAVYLNGKTLHSRGPILIKVQTDPGTVKVTSRSNGREGIVPQVAPGDFEAASTLPKIPFIASGLTTYLDFIATSASGLKTTVRVPIALQ